MKSWKSILIALVLSSLILGSLAACGGEEATTGPTTDNATEAAQVAATNTPPPPTDTPPPPTDTPLPPTNTPPPPTDTPPPTDAPEAPPAGFDPASLTTTDDMISYRSLMRITISGIQDGEPIEEVLEFLLEETTDPPAQHISMTGVGGIEEGIDSIDMYQAEGMMYMNIGGEWISIPATEGEGLEEGLLNPSDLFDDSCGWTQESDTEINGVEVYHWSADKDDIVACMAAEEAQGLGELTDAGGDIYVAKDGNYVAQMDIFYEGSDIDMGIQATEDAIEEGRVEIHSEVSDVNEPFTITIPEEALAGGALPEDIPVPEDAQETSSMFGMITFNSPSTPQEVADFYKAEMPNNGWTEVSVDDLGGMFMMEYSKEGRTANFIINTDEDTGMTSVLITVDEGE